MLQPTGNWHAACLFLWYWPAPLCRADAVFLPRTRQGRMNIREDVNPATRTTTGRSRNSASDSRCCAPKTRRWFRARAITPTTSRCPARSMPRWCARPTRMACINGIDTGEAAAMPGVLGVYTARDLARLRHLQMHRAVQEPRRLGDEEAGALRARRGKVRFVGDPVAFVVARDRGAGARCRRGGRARYRSAAGGDAGERSGAAPARRNCSTTCRTMSRSTIIMATPRR